MRQALRGRDSEVCGFFLGLVLSRGRNRRCLFVPVLPSAHHGDLEEFTMKELIKSKAGCLLVVVA
jgi:hypothetical protein